MNDEKVRVMFAGGLPSHVGELVTFRRFGQIEELDAKEAMNAARGGCCILPADDPAAVAFTADELEKRASFGSHDNAPAEFRAKVRAARVRAHEFAAEMEAAFTATLDKAQVVAGQEVTRV